MTSPNKKQYRAFVEKLAIKNLVFFKLKYIYIFYKKHFTILANKCGEVKKVLGPSMTRKESIWMLRISLCRQWVEEMEWKDWCGSLITREYVFFIDNYARFVESIGKPQLLALAQKITNEA